MENSKSNKLQVIGKAILKIVFGLLVLILICANLIYFALRIPSVQTKVAKKAAAYISQTIGHQVTIEAVDIEFFSKVVLDQVKVLDNRNQEMFYIGKAEADISMLSFFRPGERTLAALKYFVPWLKKDWSAWEKPMGLTIDELTLTEPRVNLVQYEGTDSLNLSSFIRAMEKLIKKDPDAPKSAFDFKINGISLRNGFFTYDNQNEPASEFGVDYQHLRLTRINADFSNIDLKGDTIQADIRNLNTIETGSGVHLKDLDVKMTYAPTFWEWDNLNLKVGKSNLRNYVRFDYNRFGNFSDFMDSVTVTARLDSSAIFSEDIAQFAPPLKDMNEKVLITADVKGKVTRFDAKNVNLYYGQNTHVVGNISASGLPNIKETFAQLQLQPSTLDARDLKTYIPADAYVYAQRFGVVKVNGNFTGFYNDFVANGSFQTALGNFVSDINLKLNKNKNQTSYRGYLKTDNFQIGKLIGNTDIINSISIDGRVQGSGVDARTAQLKLDAKIDAITIKGYRYRNITTDGEFRRQAFIGKFQVNDPNLNMKGNGTINLEPGKQRFDLLATIQEANLKALNLTDTDLKFKTTANLDFTGLKIDELFGFAAFRNSEVTYEGKSVRIDSLKVISALTPIGREIMVQSELVDLDAEGNFSITGLVKDIDALIDEYELNFENDPARIENYYRLKRARTLPNDYEMAFRMNMKHASPLLHLFVPELTVSDHSKVEGSFRNGQTAILSLSGQIDTVLYNKYELYRNNFEVNTSKLPYSNEILAQAFFTSGNQKVPSAGATENFFVEGIWNERKIQFATNVAQTGTTNRASISGDLNFLADRLQIVFNRSNVNILGKAWTISPANTVEIRGHEVDFKNLVLAFENQSISVLGTMSDDPQETVQVRISNFKLQNLNPLMEQKMSGILNADLMARDIYNQLILQSQLSVDSLYFDQILIGNVAGSSNWDNRLSRLMVDLGVSRDNKKVLNVNGSYNPKGGDQQLNLLAVMENAQLKLVEPFLKVIMTDLEGTMEGSIRILGRLNAPILKGVANVRNGKFNFTYLNTVYTFSDRVYFAENGITFRNIRLRDILGNTATLNGGVYHDGFQNMVIDLKANFRRFMVLNTTKQLNELYYGTAIATGDVSVFGPTENLTIRVDARSEKGTRISIPLNTQAEASRQDFINFVNHNVTDTTITRVAVQKQRADLSGIKLNFNLEVTDDAYVEIIFDERTGDIVRGTGNGRIRMNIDTRGEFSMFGQYEVTQGAYNFTLYNFINKEFLVKPGGTITWNGDPYGGILNLAAVYSQRVSMTDVLQLGTDDDPSLRRPYPVNVLMNLSGNLLNPEIKLNLEFTDIPSPVESALQPFLSSIRNDEQELNRQVFSLLAFRRFSPVGEFALAGRSDALNSLSEWASNALSYWISQVDSNLEVDIGLTGSQAGTTDVLTRIGYTFLDGRLRVTRESLISSSNASTQTSTAAAALGDWRAEYYLRPDGKLRLKLQYVTSGANYLNNNFTTSSVSIVHTEQFNTFSELFSRKRLSRRAERLRRELEERRRTQEINSDPRWEPDRPPPNL